MRLLTLASGRPVRCSFRNQDNAGEVIEAVISLSDAQLDEIKAVITRALATVDFSPEFGPGE
jgi:hypothetical protein